jgi:hypothetical protein
MGIGLCVSRANPANQGSFLVEAGALTTGNVAG